MSSFSPVSLAQRASRKVGIFKRLLTRRGFGLYIRNMWFALTLAPLQSFGQSCNEEDCPNQFIDCGFVSGANCHSNYGVFMPGCPNINIPATAQVVDVCEWCEYQVQSYCDYWLFIVHCWCNRTDVTNYVNMCCKEPSLECF